MTCTNSVSCVFGLSGFAFIRTRFPRTVHCRASFIGLRNDASDDRCSRAERMESSSRPFVSRITRAVPACEKRVQTASRALALFDCTWLACCAKVVAFGLPCYGIAACLDLARSIRNVIW